MRSRMTGRAKPSGAVRAVWVLLLAVALAGPAATLTVLAPSQARAASVPALIWSAPTQAEKPPFRDRFALDSIACPSASLCLAGDADANIYSSTNPTSATPTWSKTFASGVREASVQAIVCPSSSFCAAVIPGGGVDFYTSTDPGSATPSWTAATTGVAATGVSCPSVKLCVGVGQRIIMTSTDPAVGASSAWKTAKLTLSSDQINLTSVSCPSATLCVAIDNGGDVLTSTNPAGGTAAWTVTNVDGQVSLSDLSCPSVSFCAALDALGRVEYSTNPTGGASAWLRVTGPSNSGLTTFSCESASFCTAADGSGNIVTTSDPTAGAAGWTSADDDQNHPVNVLTCLRATLCVAGDQRGDVAESTDPTGGPSAWNVRNVAGFTLMIGLDCPSASLCVGGDQAGNIVTSKRPAAGPGAWHAANVDGPVGDIDAVSCPSASLCVAADALGNVFTSTDPTGGASAWQEADVDPNHWIYSLTCPSTTLCVAGDLSGDIITSTNPTGGVGAWQVTNIDGTSGIYSISCPSVSLCLAGDSSGDTGNAGIFTSTDPAGGAGAWQPTRFLPALGIKAISCPNTSFCVAGGIYGFGDREPDGAIFSSTDPLNSASWQVIEVGDEESSMSCPSTSFCVAVGVGALVSGLPASGNPADWQQLPPPMSSGLAVSCATVSFCVVSDSNGNVETGTPPAPTTTTITSVTRFPVVGQPIKIGVRVANTTHGQGNATPAGTVTVTDGTRSCSAALSGSAGVAAGSCVLVATKAGSYSLSASYPAQISLAGSKTSTPTRVKVGRATSKATLNLSAAKIRYGHEQSEKLTISVRPEFAGSPTGIVIIRSGGTAICTLTLRRGAVSCKLKSKQLAVGTHKLTARYRGSGDFVGSASATRSVKVVR